jgi:hypothetical protein
MSNLLVRVPRRMPFKPLLARHSAIDFLWRDHLFFRNAVRDHADRSVEEIQYPVMNSSKTDPELVDSAPQEVCFGPPQFVAKSRTAAPTGRSTCPEPSRAVR